MPPFSRICPLLCMRLRHTREPPQAALRPPSSAFLPSSQTVSAFFPPGVHAPPRCVCLVVAVRAPSPSLHALLSFVCALTSSVLAPLCSCTHPYFIHGRPLGSCMCPYGCRSRPPQSRVLCSPYNIMETYIHPFNVAVTWQLPWQLL
jgi:hypothetical protein